MNTDVCMYLTCMSSLITDLHSFDKPVSGNKLLLEGVKDVQEKRDNLASSLCKYTYAL